MSEFPTRVTLYDDGIYRWSYDMDMWRNRYLLGLILKILCLLLGIPTLFVSAMALKEWITLLGRGLTGAGSGFFIRDDLLLVAVVGGMWIGMMLLTLIVYAIAAAAMRGTWRLCFQMDDSAVALVRSPKTMKAVNTFGMAAAALGLAIGDRGGSMRIGSTLAVANNTGTSRFDSVRRVKCVPGLDLLDLREWFGMNQIYVPGEDYAFVRDFIFARVSDKARSRSGA